MQENKKMLDSYDVLKEHEVNIIKDVQEQKKKELSGAINDITQLKVKADEKDAIIRSLERRLQEVQESLRHSIFDTRRLNQDKELAGEAH